MTYSFFIGIYISLFTLLWGISIQKELLKLWDVNDYKPALFHALIIGLIGTSSVMALISFFRPIDIWVHYAWTITIVLASIINRKEIIIYVKHGFNIGSRHKYIFLVLAVIYILSIYMAAGFVTMPDTGFYHIPLVKWLNNYGIVKGLANLQDTLGFMSGWFYYAALFDFGIFDDLSYHFLNAIAYTWGWGMAAKMLIHFSENTFGAKDYIILPLTIYLFASTSFIASISPQLILSILVFWVLYQTIDIVEQKGFPSHKLGYLALAMGFCLFLKLSTLPVFFLLFIITVYCIRAKHGSFLFFLRQSYTLFLPFFILLGIYFYKNLILSGYIVYPIVEIDLFDVDWKLPENQVQVLTEHIRNRGIYGMYRTRVVIEDYLSLSWFFNWVNRNIYYAHWPTITTCLIFLPVSILTSVLLIRKTKFNKEIESLFYIYCALILGVIFWFTTSPNPRFGAVWVLSAFCFPLAIYIKVKRQFVNSSLRNLGVLYFLSLAIWLYFFIQKSEVIIRTTGPGNYLITWVLDHYSPEYRKVKISDGTTINIPVNKKFPAPFDIPLPSSGQELNYKTQIDTAFVLRGATLGEGFRPTNLKEE